MVRARLQRALVALRERLVAMYETGRPDMLSVIVGADGYDELIDRSRVPGTDPRDGRSRGRPRPRAARPGAAHGRAAAPAQGPDRSRPATRSPPKSRRWPTPARRVQERQSKLVAARADREAALAKINDHEEELDGEVAAIQGEIAAQLGGSGSAPLPAGPIQPGSGSGLIWPVDGPVVSGFGMRIGGYECTRGSTSPCPKGRRSAPRPPAPSSSPQSEAESGGYGNFTCIDHGGGLSTCYAHQSSFAVSAGQSVSQGEVIGYSGCTGHCFGAHLHFEVRIGGVPTDPLGYL